MSYYRLFFDGVEFGDEIIMPIGEWEKNVDTTKTDLTKSILPLDDNAIAVAMYPKFRLRKKCDNAWDFERWLFDLVSWADGSKRQLRVLDDELGLVADFDFCKLLSLSRPEADGILEGRWSDEIILTFQADEQPKFFS